jgi:hypothetical protein
MYHIVPLPKFAVIEIFDLSTSSEAELYPNYVKSSKKTYGKDSSCRLVTLKRVLDKRSLHLHHYMRDLRTMIESLPDLDKSFHTNSSTSLQKSEEAEENGDFEG